METGVNYNINKYNLTKNKNIFSSGISTIGYGAHTFSNDTVMKPKVEELDVLSSLNEYYMYNDVVKNQEKEYDDSIKALENELTNELSKGDRTQLELAIKKLKQAKTLVKYNALKATNEYQLYVSNKQNYTDDKWFEIMDKSTFDDSASMPHISYDKCKRTCGAEAPRPLDWLKKAIELYDYNNDDAPLENGVRQLETSGFGNADTEQLLKLVIEIEDLYPEFYNLYNYIYEKQGMEAANEFIKNSEELINQLVGEKRAAEFLNTLNEQEAEQSDVVENVVKDVSFGLAKNLLKEGLKNSVPGADKIVDGAGTVVEAVTNQNSPKLIENHLNTLQKGLCDGVESFEAGISAWFEGNDVTTVNEYESMYIMQALSKKEDKEKLHLINENGSSSSSLIDYTKNYGKLLDSNYKYSQAIGNMLPSMAISLVNPMAGTVSLGVSAGGQNYHQSLVNGYGVGDAFVYGLLTGTTAATLERLIGKIPGLGKIGESEAFISKVFGEGTEELIEQVTQSVVWDQIILGKTVNLDDLTSDSIESFVDGAIISAILNGPSTAINFVSNGVSYNLNSAQIEEIQNKVTEGKAPKDAFTEVTQINLNENTTQKNISEEAVNKAKEMLKTSVNSNENINIENINKEPINKAKDMLGIGINEKKSENNLEKIDIYGNLNSILNKKISLKKVALGSVASIPGIVDRFIYRKLGLNADLSSNVINNGIYHLTSEEGASAILESGYVKASGNVTSYGTKKSFFFAGIPDVNNVALNLSDLPSKITAVKIKPKDTDILNSKMKYRPSDNVITYSGDYSFENSNAELVYLCLVEENGNLNYKEVSKEFFDNYNVKISNSKAKAYAISTQHYNDLTMNIFNKVKDSIINKVNQNSNLDTSENVNVSIPEISNNQFQNRLTADDVTFLKSQSDGKNYNKPHDMNKLINLTHSIMDSIIGSDSVNNILNDINVLTDEDYKKELKNRKDEFFDNTVLGFCDGFGKIYFPQSASNHTVFHEIMHRCSEVYNCGNKINVDGNLKKITGIRKFYYNDKGVLTSSNMINEGLTDYLTSKYSDGVKYNNQYSDIVDVWESIDNSLSKLYDSDVLLNIFIFNDYNNFLDSFFKKYAEVDFFTVSEMCDTFYKNMKDLKSLTNKIEKNINKEIKSQNGVLARVKKIFGEKTLENANNSVDNNTKQNLNYDISNSNVQQNLNYGVSDSNVQQNLIYGISDNSVQQNLNYDISDNSKQIIENVINFMEEKYGSEYGNGIGIKLLRRLAETGDYNSITRSNNARDAIMSIPLSDVQTYLNNISDVNYLIDKNSVMLNKMNELSMDRDIFTNQLEEIINYTDATVPDGYSSATQYKRDFVRALIETGKLDQFDNSYYIYQLTRDSTMLTELMNTDIGTDKLNALYTKNLESLPKLLVPTFENLSIEAFNKIFDNPTMQNYINDLDAKSLAKILKEFNSINNISWLDSSVITNKIINMKVEDFYTFIKSLGNVAGNVKNVLNNSEVSTNNFSKILDAINNKFYTFETVMKNPEYKNLVDYIVPFSIDSKVSEKLKIYKDNKDAIVDFICDSIIKNSLVTIEKKLGMLSIKGDSTNEYHILTYEIDGVEKTLEVKGKDKIWLDFLAQNSDIIKAASNGNLKIKSFETNITKSNLVFTEEKGLQKGLNEVILVVDGVEHKVTVNLKYRQVDLNNKFPNAKSVEVKSIKPIGNLNVEVEEANQLYLVTYNLNGEKKQVYMDSEKSKILNINNYVAENNLSEIADIQITKVDDQQIKKDLPRINRFSASKDIYSNLKYGGNQSDVKNLVEGSLNGKMLSTIDTKKSNILLQLIEKHFPNITDVEKINLADKYASGGCCYMAVANAFATYMGSIENGTEIFKEKLGYDLMTTDGDITSYNVEAIAFDIFLEYCSKNYDSVEEILNKESIGIAAFTFDSIVTDFFTNHGINVDAKIDIDNLSKSSILNNQFNILIAKHFDIMQMSSAQNTLESADRATSGASLNGNLVCDVGSHAMLITDFDDNLNYIVSSWSKKFKFLHESIDKYKKSGKDSRYSIWNINFSIPNNDTNIKKNNVENINKNVEEIIYESNEPMNFKSKNSMIEKGNLEKQIFNNMPNGLNKLETARYIYIELAKELSFSTKFQNTDNKTFSKMFTQKVLASDLDSREVNCRMWAQLYSQLLDKAGIANQIIDRGHQHVEFYIDNKKYVADATDGQYTDLARIKNGDTTTHFGLAQYQDRDHNYNIVSPMQNEEFLNNIDKKIGYVNEKNQTLRDFKKHLEDIKSDNIDIVKHFGLKNSDPDTIFNFKLNYLFSTIGNLNDGYYESKDFIYELERCLFTEEELQNIGATELKRTNKDGSVNIIQCIYVNTNEGYDYYLLAPNLPVQKFDANQILSLSSMGYGKEKKDIPGINFPKVFQPGKINSNIKYKLQNIFGDIHNSEINKYAEQKARMLKF